MRKLIQLVEFGSGLAALDSEGGAWLLQYNPMAEKKWVELPSLPCLPEETPVGSCYDCGDAIVMTDAYAVWRPSLGGRQIFLCESCHESGKPAEKGLDSPPDVL